MEHRHCRRRGAQRGPAGCEILGTCALAKMVRITVLNGYTAISMLVTEAVG